MLRTLTLIACAITASPALANYGDLDAQIADLKAEVVFVALPATANAETVAVSDICPLPLDHIVSVPDSFGNVGNVEMACLDN